MSKPKKIKETLFSDIDAGVASLSSSSSSVSPILSKSPLPTCSTCRFWNNKGENMGICHRYPPSLPSPILTQQGITSLRPLTSFNEWCGEYSPIITSTEIN